MEQMRTWTEISLSALKHNYQYLRSLAPESGFLGLCKANAYGHDVKLIAPALVEMGAEMLAVATAVEGAELRELGIKSPILVLGDTPVPWFPLLAEHDLTQTVHCREQGEALDRYFTREGKALYIHCKIDSGMGRLGFSAEEQAQTVEEITSLFRCEHLKIEGVFTHFSSSEDDNKQYYTATQYNLFRQIVDALPFRPRYCHCANSGGVLYHPDCHGDLIRPGLALYGYDPTGPSEQLRPVMTLKSRLGVIRSMKQGQPVSYGGSTVLARDSLVGVLPLGYGDGIPRHLSNGFEVLISGVACPILGRVCMDMTMVDLTDLKGRVDVGAVAVVYGEEDLLLKAAERSGTIPYELLCHLTPRVPRILVD